MSREFPDPVPSPMEKIEGSATPEPWFDSEREKSYAGVLQEFHAIKESGYSDGKGLYMTIEHGMDPRFKSKLNRHLQESDFESIHMAEVTSRTASEVAGTEIKRGVFIVDDGEVYQKLEKVFFSEGGTTHGVVIPGRAFSELPHFRDVGIILAKNDDALISHEVRHTIDPHLSGSQHERTGNDRILAEAFAEYQNIIVAQGDWQAYRKFLDNYLGLYDKKEGLKTKKEDWDKIADSVVEKVKALRSKHNDIETQRLILKSRNVAEFLLQE